MRDLGGLDVRRSRLVTMIICYFGRRMRSWKSVHSVRRLSGRITLLKKMGHPEDRKEAS